MSCINSEWVVSKKLCDIIKKLDSKTGIPGPCPKCNSFVIIAYNNNNNNNNNKFQVKCRKEDKCDYSTKKYNNATSAWKEHEKNNKKSNKDVTIIV